MAEGEKWNVPKQDKEEAPALLLWYHGRSMVVHGGTMVPPWYRQSGKGRSGQLELARARAHFVNAI